MNDDEESLGHSQYEESGFLDSECYANPQQNMLRQVEHNRVLDILIQGVIIFCSIIFIFIAMIAADCLPVHRLLSALFPLVHQNRHQNHRWA